MINQCNSLNWIWLECSPVYLEVIFLELIIIPWYRYCFEVFKICFWNSDIDIAVVLGKMDDFFEVQMAFLQHGSEFYTKSGDLRWRNLRAILSWSRQGGFEFEHRYFAEGDPVWLPFLKRECSILLRRVLRF